MPAPIGANGGMHTQQNFGYRHSVGRAVRDLAKSHSANLAARAKATRKPPARLHPKVRATTIRSASRPALPVAVQRPRLAISHTDTAGHEVSGYSPAPA